MKLIIDDNYQIVSDPMQYILQEKKIIKESKEENKVGTEYYDNIGYYGKIVQALKGYKELEIRKSDVTSIDELMALIYKLDKKIDDLLKNN